MPVSVSDFFEQGKEKLALQIVSGEAGMSRIVKEAAINRPGLALTGFFRYFAHRRIQVIGLAEGTYLASLSKSERAARVKAVFAQHIPCIVVTRQRKVPPEISELGERGRVPVLRSRLVTHTFVNAATLLMEELNAPRTRRQGTMVDVFGVGVLIEGPAGIGKSEAALSLIEKGYSLVADDVTELRRASSGDVYGSAVAITRYHMQIRGLGIIHVPSLFGVTSVRNECRLDLVITLMPPGAKGDEDISGLTHETCTVLGTEVPRVRLTVAPGRELGYLIEVAAHNTKLRSLGHDAAKELDTKLIEALRRK